MQVDYKIIIGNRDKVVSKSQPYVNCQCSVIATVIGKLELSRSQMWLQRWPSLVLSNWVKHSPLCWRSFTTMADFSSRGLTMQMNNVDRRPSEILIWPSIWSGVYPGLALTICQWSLRRIRIPMVRTTFQTLFIILTQSDWYSTMLATWQCFVSTSELFLKTHLILITT